MQALNLFFKTHFATNLAGKQLRRQLIALNFSLFLFLLINMFAVGYYVAGLDTKIVTYAFCFATMFLGTFLLSWRSYHYASILYMVICINVGFAGGMLLWGSPFEIGITFLPLICCYFVFFDLKDKTIFYLVVFSVGILVVIRIFDWSSFVIDTPAAYKKAIYLALVIISAFVSWYFISTIAKASNQTEKELELQSFAMDSAGDSVLWLDKSGRICYANKMAVKTFKYEKSILLQNDVFLLCRNFSSDEWQNTWQTLEKNGLMYLEHLFCDANNEKIDMNISFSLMHTGQEHYACAFMKDISEQKHSENVKQAEKNVLKNIAQGYSVQASVGIFLRNLEHSVQKAMYSSILLINKEGIEKEKLTYYSAPNLPESYIDILEATEIEVNASTSGRAVFNRQTIIIENIDKSDFEENYKETTKNHHFKACCALPMFASNGEVLGVLTLYYDTEQKPTNKDLEILESAKNTLSIIIERSLTDKALRKSEADNKALIKAMPDIIFMLDKDGYYQKVITDNDADLSRPIEEIIGKNVTEIMPKTLANETLKMIKEVTTTGILQSFEYARNNNYGILNHYEARMVPHENGGVVTMVRNITLRKKNERIIEENNIKMNAILESTSHIMFALDTDYRYTAFNLAHSMRMKKYANIDISLGMEHPLLSQNNLIKSGMRDFERVVKGEQFVSLDSAIAQTGERIFYEIFYNPIHDANSKIIGFAVFAQDVTQRILFEEELKDAKIKAEAGAKAKSAFLSNMSHEIRTPMNVIMGLTNIVLQDNLSAKSRENLRTVKSATENLLGIVNDILDISKIEAGKVTLEEKDFDLFELLKDIERVFSFSTKEKKLYFNVNMADNMPKVVKGDRLRLNQILINLLGNAFKFTNEGGVTLTVSILTENAYQNANMVRFVIADTGIGIPASQQKSIFESFTQAFSDKAKKIQGTGLGLAITKQLVELQNGQIYVTSELGKGSNFIIELPFLKTNNTQIITENPSNKQQQEQISLKGMRILLAEDNLLNQFVAKQILEEWEIVLEIANTGVEVLEKMAKQDFDLILMDLQMPEMDGFEATEYIRTKLSAPENSIPIIALTADAFQDTRQKALEIGMNAVVTKPFQTEELFSAIAQFATQTVQIPQIQPITPQETIQKTSDLTSNLRQNDTQTQQIDINHLNKLLNNDNKALKQLFKIFTENFSVDIKMLKKAQESQDLPKLESLAHKLKSTFGTFGIHHTSKILLEIEKNAMNGINQEDLAVLVSEVTHSYECACAEIKDILEAAVLQE